MAEGVFRELTSFGTSEQHSLIGAIDSCGTAAYHSGDRPDSRTMSTLRDNDITRYQHQARKVRVPEDFKTYDFILAMDDANLSNLQDMAERAIKKGTLEADVLSRVHLYGEFGGKAKNEEVVDPYYGGREGFNTVYEQCVRFGKGLLKHIEEQAAGESKI